MKYGNRVHVDVILSDDEHAALLANAKAQGLSLSAFVRQRAISGAKMDRSPSDDAIKRKTRISIYFLPSELETASAHANASDVPFWVYLRRVALPKTLNPAQKQPTNGHRKRRTA